jgi:hypothetical protein
MTTHAHSKPDKPRKKKTPIHSVPIWLKGLLNPTLSFEEKGMMASAAAAVFAKHFADRPEIVRILAELNLTESTLPEQPNQLANYLDLPPDEWNSRSMQFLWDNFNTDTTGWYRLMDTEPHPSTEQTKPTGEKPHVRL